MREQTEQIRPPRALWVPFELGRPFGAPGDAAFQRRVLDALLALFDAKSGPMLADFPDDAPAAATEDPAEGWACPVAFPLPPVDPDDLGAAVATEIAGLAPWYETAVRERGRTTVGVSAFTIEDAAKYAAGFLDALPETGPDAAIRLKRAIEDLKAFYSEAVTVRPGSSSDQVTNWLWGETTLGEMMHRLANSLAKSGDADLRYFAEHSLVPRAQAARRRMSKGS